MGPFTTLLKSRLKKEMHKNDFESLHPVEKHNISDIKS